MEVVFKELKGCRTRLSGNTEAGQTRYIRHIQTMIEKIEADPAYARRVFDKLSLYNEEGIFKGDILE